jgi:2-methylcitrate dehydratase PrpD
VDSITQIIAEYASTLAFEHLPAEAVHAAKQRLIDSLGCAVGAHDCEPAQIGRRLAGGQTPANIPAEFSILENGCRWKARRLSIRR